MINWRFILVVIVVIIVLSLAGPENTANFIKQIGGWIGQFLNSL